MHSFENVSFLDSWPLTMGSIGCPEMSVRNYHYLLRNSPEERSVHVWINSCTHTHTHTHTHPHKYLGIILRSDLSWADQVNYAVKKAWKALHFTMRILKKGNSNTKSLAYMSLVRPILEYGAAFWDPYRERQISALDRVQKNANKFAHHKNIPNWETLASRRKLSRICALFKAYSGERAWKPIGDRLQRPHYVGRVDQEGKLGVGGKGRI